MTRDEINQSIAVSLGAKWLYSPLAAKPHRLLVSPGTYVSHSDSFVEWDGKTEMPIMHSLPMKDYCKDIEAMRVPINKLPSDKVTTFWEELIYLTNSAHGTNAEAIQAAYAANPMIWAAVYLKTIGKISCLEEYQRILAYCGHSS